MEAIELYTLAIVTKKSFFLEISNCMTKILFIFLIEQWPTNC